MSMLTRKDVTALFGELDDVVIAKIIATGATPDWSVQEYLEFAGRSLRTTMQPFAADRSEQEPTH